MNEVCSSCRDGGAGGEGGGRWEERLSTANHENLPTTVSLVSPCAV
jgi:hypothetical protein